ncbi:U-box domain containing protein [Leishmania donovani]|uniref:U-box_domain_containing_protein_putative/Pfam:PF0 4564 n=1 Tax=Leishmania donovani TaxID=5661 RepID=A0A6J8F3W9_LEIDO|nr:U-box domain containing protein [Leishmania donovani]VDZ42050.1 U-box_domain_containing_protein_putative/Pfam:PF04564 [Leishmania donovani]
MQTTNSLLVSRAVARLCAVLGDELFPVVIWLSMFGATRLAPSLVLHLSMSLPQVMDVPRLLLWRRRRGVYDGAPNSSYLGSSISAAADAAAAHLAELIKNTPPGSSSDGILLGGGSSSSSSSGAYDAALRASWQRIYHQSLEVLVSLVTYPTRLWTYFLFQRSQRASLRDAAAAARGGGNGRAAVAELLVRLVTSFTSTWIHASGSMLFDTIVTYLSTRIGSWGSGSVGGGNAIGGSGRRHSGWRDLLVASCVSTGLNFALQTYWVEALTSMGELRALPLATTAREALSLSFSERMQLALSALSRLGGKEFLYRLCRVALQPQPDQRTSPAEGEQVYASPLSPSNTAALQPRTRAADSSLLSSPASATPRAQSQPARAYLCGGNAFVFALSGFRFSYYGDPQQFTTAASNCITDALDLVLRQARQRAAAQNGRVTEALLEGQVWRPPVSSSSSYSHDVVLAPAASLQLLPVYIANFAVGAGVGLVWRRRHLLAAARRVPLLRRVVKLLFPLPPPPLRLPEALQELSPECHVLLVHPDGRVEVSGNAPLPESISKADAPAATTTMMPDTPSADASPSPRITRIVVAQDLFCPIKRTLMCDPVQTADGFTYDRDSIEEWLLAHDTAPLTNLHLDNTTLRVNWRARQLISGLVLQYTAAAGITSI